MSDLSPGTEDAPGGPPRDDLADAEAGGAIADVGLLIRRYPAQTLLAGVALGYLLARWRMR